MSGLVVQLCDTITESQISATQHGPARLLILLKQTHVAHDSYSRNLGLFKAMWSGIEVKVVVKFEVKFVVLKFCLFVLGSERFTSCLELIYISKISKLTRHCVLTNSKRLMNRKH